MKHQETHPSLDVPGCNPCKWSSISFGTVPGARRDREKGLGEMRRREKSLHRYRDKRKAGEQPDGTTPEAIERYERRLDSWEKSEKELTDSSPPETVERIKRSTLNAA